jgi:hypothetical protein
MRQLFVYAFVVLICLSLAVTASAEFYKYRDHNGVLRYTDNLADVPEDQRPKMKTHKAAEDYQTPQQTAAKERKEADRSNQDLEAARERNRQRQAKLLEAGGAPSPEALQQAKNALDQEYAELMQEKEALAKSKETIKTVPEAQAYRDRVTALNKKITDFESRRQMYSKQVDTFNEAVKKATQKK